MSLFADHPSDKRFTAFISYSHAVDRQLAPALKSALQRLARPWYALRAMRVFHDTTNLSVSPDLWGAIEAVLKDAEFLLLLASPAAAASKWVRKEVETFAVTGRANNVVLILTAGELHWDEETGDFDWSKTTALPRLARPLFPRQPLFIDMRWAQLATQLDLGDPRFRRDIASISSALLGVELDELIERDIIERRRSLRLARAAVIALATLCVGVLASSVLFVVQRDIAQSEANVARARQLAAEADLVVAQDPSRIDTAVRLAADGLRLHPGVETDRALRNALALFAKRVAAGRHSGSVDQIHVLADGMFLSLSGNRSSLPEDNRIRLWNLADGAEQRVIDTVDTLMALAVSKDGRRIVGGGFERVLRVWDVSSGRLIAASKPHKTQIGTIALFRDGRVVATAGYDSKVQLWRTDDASPLATLTHGDRVNTVVAAGEADTLLTASDDGTARLWTVDGRELRRFRAKGIMSRAIFLGQGRVVVTASAGGAVRLWDARTGWLMRMLPHDKDVEHFEGSADGRLLATAEINGPVRIWEASTGRELRRISTERNVNSLAFDATGTQLATGSFQVAQLWDVRTGAETARVRTSGWANAVALTGTPLRLLVGSSDGAVGVWTVEGHSTVYRRSSDGAVLDLKVAPAGAPIAIVSGGRPIPGGEMDLASDFRRTALWQPPDSVRYLEHGGKVLAVAFSPDGSSLAAAVGSAVQVVDTATGKERFHVHHDNTVLEISWSGDGQTLASGGWDKKARLWSAATGEPTLVIPHPSEVTAVVLDRAGKTLTTASGTTVRVFDLSARDSARPRLQAVAAQNVASLTLDPMGQHLVLGDRGGNLSMHDLRTNARRWLRRHDDEVLAIRIFESEGKSYVASGGKDQTARIWDAETGQELARLQHAAAVRAIDVSPDGRLLVTGADDRTTRIFLWRPRDLLAEAESRLRDAPATEQQSADNVGSEPRLSLDWIKQWFDRQWLKP